MKERPVIFNGEMVRAILDGRKTQTRRVMKVQPSEHFHPMNMSLELDYSARWYTPGVIDKDGYLQPATGQVFGVAGEDEGYACPFGTVGDRLWVRETWSSDFANYYPNDRVWYAADNNRCSDIEVVNGVRGIYSPESDVHVPFRWRPSIHMPRWASRITLEITAVRVERLNDISHDDAKAEGCCYGRGGGEFIPKNLDRALAVVGLSIPESREEFNFQTERWIQRLIDRVIRYSDEFPAPAVNAAPDFEAWFVEKYKQPERLIKNEDGTYKFSGVQMAFSAWNACRAAMLAAVPEGDK
ncbi:hypothetical protein UDZ25_14225 [Serratia marcescens]